MPDDNRQDRQDGLVTVGHFRRWNKLRREGNELS
jgi:hypothetical protein